MNAIRLRMQHSHSRMSSAIPAWIADAMSSPDASRFCAAFVCAAWKKSAALMASVAMIITWPPMISSSGEHAISR